MWDLMAAGNSHAPETLKEGVEQLGLKGEVKYMEHQQDGWKCGYYSMWYLSQALRAPDTLNMADLQLPNMGSDFTTRVQ